MTSNASLSKWKRARELSTLVKVTMALAEAHEAPPASPTSPKSPKRAAWDSDDGGGGEQSTGVQALVAPIIDRLSPTEGDAGGPSSTEDQEEALRVLHMLLSTTATMRAHSKFAARLHQQRQRLEQGSASQGAKQQQEEARRQQLRSQTEAQRVTAVLRSVKHLNHASQEAAAAELWTLTLQAEDKLPLALAGAVPAVAQLMREGNSKTKERSAAILRMLAPYEVSRRGCLEGGVSKYRYK